MKEISDKLHFIYALCHPETKIIRYIGQTSKGMKRPLGYRKRSFYCTNKHLVNWLQKLRKNGLVCGILVIEEFEDEHSLDEREIFWIAKYKEDGNSLLNATDGGGGVRGFKDWTEEEIERRRNIFKGKKLVFTEEHKRNLSIAIKNSEKKKEAHKKAIEKLRGRKHTEEHKKKVRDKITGLVRSPEQRARMSAGMKGIKKSDEHIKNSVEAKRINREKRKQDPNYVPKVMSEELRKKFSVAIKEGWARNKRRREFELKIAIVDSLINSKQAVNPEFLEKF